MNTAPFTSTPPPGATEAAASGLNATSSHATSPAATHPHTHSSDAPVDHDLVRETKHQIRAIVNEIAQLAQSDILPAEFYDGFLARLVSALACIGGAVWAVNENGSLELQFQVNLGQAELSESTGRASQHALLLKRLLADGQAVLVPPRSGPADDEVANPTDFLLVVAPLTVENQVVALVEILQRPGGGPTTQRGYLRFLVQMCELASDFLTTHRLRLFNRRQELWQELEQFLRALYGKLDSRMTAATIANDGRTLIDCDRVSVAIRRGRRYEVVAVSGLDAIDRRADQVARLAQLSKAVAAARTPVWYPRHDCDIAPQIEDLLHGYLDASHSRLIGIVPLMPPGDDENKSTESEPVGTLIVEQMKDARPGDHLHQRVEVVADHAATALHTAREHESLFLLPVWKTLGNSRLVWQARSLPKTLAALVLIAALVAALVFVPADFDLGARGKIQPAQRSDVFARTNGVVAALFARHGDDVLTGQVLAKMRNATLAQEMTSLEGKRQETRQRVQAIQRELLEQRADPVTRNRLWGEQRELEETLRNLNEQIRLQRQKSDELSVPSPRDGRVVTWQVEESLLHRPVQQGQVLMTVVDPDGDWELELYLPERRLGHVQDALAGDPAGLPVSFVLSTHPNREFSGRVVELHQRAEPFEDEGNTVRLRVAIDAAQLPRLHSETTVTASVHCGREPVGYVWFHELIETVHTRLLFWF